MLSHYSTLALSAAILLNSSLAICTESPQDPTRPYTESAMARTKAETFKVTAIFISRKRRVAVINGQRVTEGDEVNGATVIEILADGLRLNLRGKEITTRLVTARLQK